MWRANISLRMHIRRKMPSQAHHGQALMRKNYSVMRNNSSIGWISHASSPNAVLCLQFLFLIWRIRAVVHVRAAFPMGWPSLSLTRR